MFLLLIDTDIDIDAIFQRNLFTKNTHINQTIAILFLNDVNMIFIYPALADVLSIRSKANELASE